MSEVDGTERIAQLLRLLPAPPAALVAAAKEIPQTRAEVDQIVSWALADAAFRARLIADLEGALAAKGFEPRPAVVAELRHRLHAD